MLIFISYSRQNQELVDILARDLATLGHSVWLDEELTGGQTWWDHILAKVRECDVFVAGLSPAALDSAACKLEHGYAAKLGKPILPVLLAEGVSLNLLPPALSAIQYVDYRRQERHEALALARAIAALPRAAALPDPMPEPPPAPMSYLSGLKDQIEAATPLTFEDQTALVVRLKQRLVERDTRADARKLLMQLRSRDDLFAKVASEIDGTLGTAGQREPTAPARPVSRDPIAAPPPPPPRVSSPSHESMPLGAPEPRPAPQPAPQPQPHRMDVPITEAPTARPATRPETSAGAPAITRIWRKGSRSIGGLVCAFLGLAGVVNGAGEGVPGAVMIGIVFLGIGGYLIRRALKHPTA
jgi:hypothetical protein